MKHLIKEILYAAHECGICPDWGDKVCEDILEILKRDGIVNQNNINEEELDKLAEESVPSRFEYTKYTEIESFKEGYRKAKEK